MSLVIAHRGASGVAPENTLAAFRLAWSLGADGIEMDVHLSADGQVLVHHDVSTQRCAGVDWVVSEYPAAKLQELDVGRWKGPQFAGERIPTLDDVLALKPTGHCLVELKTGPEIVDPLARVLARWPDTPVRLISFHQETLEACRDAFPQRPCLFLSESCYDDEGKAYHPLTLIEQALQAGFVGLDPEYTGIDAAFAQRTRDAGLELYTWTVNDPQAAQQLSQWGVQGITGDYPDQLLAALTHAPS